jgi:hypothetical protein
MPMDDRGGPFQHGGFGDEMRRRLRKLVGVRGLRRTTEQPARDQQPGEDEQPPDGPSDGDAGGGGGGPPPPPPLNPPA